MAELGQSFDYEGLGCKKDLGRKLRMLRLETVWEREKPRADCAVLESHDARHDFLRQQLAPLFR